MAKQFYFYSLVFTVLLVGNAFFRVVQPLLFPVMGAAVFATLFHPAYKKLTAILFGRSRIAAGAMTFLLVFCCLAPLSVVLYLTGEQLMTAAQDVMAMQPLDWKWVETLQEQVRNRLSGTQWLDLQDTLKGRANAYVVQIYDQTGLILGNVIEGLFALVVFLFSLYYFLADGEKIFQTCRNLAPLEEEDFDKLYEEFSRVCRGVMLGTIVAAFVQAVLAGIGYAVAGVDRVWLYATCTMVTAMLPFVGSAATYLPLSLMLMANGRPLAGTLLAAYCLGVVSTSDNFVRAYVLDDTAHLHPLIAFVSAIGAIQWVGLWGIFVGPICAAFFYALLRILRRHVREESEDEIRV